MTKFSVDEDNFAPITIKSKSSQEDQNNNGDYDNPISPHNSDNRFNSKYDEANQNDKNMRKRKSTLCCLLQTLEHSSLIVIQPTATSACMLVFQC